MIQKQLGASLAGKMPGVETVTLGSRTSTAGVDSFTDILSVRARRKAVSPERKLAAGVFTETDIAVQWEIYLTDALIVTPKVGDQITDADGVIYQIKSGSTFKLTGGAYPFLCVQNR